MVNKNFKDFINESKDIKTEADEEEVLDNDVEETSNDNTDIHTKGIEFLKSQVDEYCTNGYYQLYWDYRESLDESQIQEYVDKAIAEDTSLESVVSDELWDMNIDYENNFFDEIENNIPDELSEYAEERDLIDDLEEAGYKGLDVNAKDLLDNSGGLKVNVIYATPEEQNYDMGSIVNCYGSWRQPNWNELETSDLDNGMTYTINQQGHSAKEYYDCYLENQKGFGLDHKSTFIESCVDDCVNNTSDYMSAMCVLTRLSVEEYYELMKMVKAGEGTLTFSADSYCGTVNIWAGSGGLSVNLEKPLSIPVSYIHTVQLEGAKENNGYTVDEIFGLVGECWDGKMTFGGDVATLENLDELLAYIKTVAPKEDEEEEEE